MNFLELLNKPELIVAHRGANSLSPENTLNALKKSIGRADFIEIDTQLSKDGIAIIMHDDTLLRTTNVSQLSEFDSKKPYRVCDFTFEELKRLDYGSWFYTDNSKAEPLLTLHDALIFIKENNLFLNLEIKDISYAFSDNEVVEKIVKEINDIQCSDRVLVSSFRHEYLKIIKTKLHIPTAALAEDSHPKELLSYLRGLGVDGYCLNDELVDKKSVEMLREAGFFVGVYTVNSTLRSHVLFEMGVNFIFSDSLYKDKQ
ncbi:Glycerophosphoryl diester phosphodiesterase [Sulfurimonas denitrificans DSM 1251]|uniref:Glycerophosphoryl diester phosphodiesterase n=1 Tax=Sulfurimonas denitrificans (strain ATCC 33889 / DSM 1251) TaxID=326298 RepID=Q30R72_SULDN|nr:glycerophosphodiester phosphodiesterase family protein [Sulfurimonas denitrificans]ABB44509.1 Glycerophosphoryl diester phosphodiesterase [Sulfurimonas denitrificans DSM 1251]MDD3441691.1 glycerophosphodiester phosphodiesterase family protein [Sulfurimonas denitrificans]